MVTATEEKPRIQKVAEELYKSEDLMRPKEIAEILNESALNIGRDLHDLKRRGLADSEGEGLWKITDEGREWIESGGGKVKVKPSKAEISGTVPTQIDLLRSIGENLKVGEGKKGGVTLDAAMYYVEHTANLNDLNSVWNRLTEIGVSDPVKKVWLTMYAQTLKKEIPEELKEKIEAGEEKLPTTDKDKGETVTPKPKRFSIVEGEIVGDPDGEYSFIEAFKIWAKEKAVPPDQVNPLSIALDAMLQASKEAPQTITTMLSTFLPLITKPSDTSGDNIWLQLLKTQQENSQNQMTMFQTMITTLTEEKHKAELATLNTQIEAIRTGQKAPGASEEMQVLAKRIDDLTQSLHQAQIDSVKEQSQRDKEILLEQIKGLENRLSAISQGVQTDGRLHLLENVVNKAGSEATGLRGDFGEFMRYMIEKGIPRPPMTSEEKAKIAAVGKKAVGDQRRIAQLASEILSS